jgi:hypothetical protein
MDVDWGLILESVLNIGCEMWTGLLRAVSGCGVL